MKHILFVNNNTCLRSISWLIDNVGIAGEGWAFAEAPPSFDRTFVCFLREEDAVAFKLKFGV